MLHGELGSSIIGRKKSIIGHARPRYRVLVLPCISDW